MRLALIVLAVSASVLGACNREDAAPTADAGSTSAAGPVPQPMDLGGAPVDPGATVLATAARAANLTTFVSALQAAGLERSLSQNGPVTVFAPSNEAWAAIDADRREGLVRPEGHEALVRLLNSHMVDGRIPGSELAESVRAGGGTAVLTTRAGGRLTIRDLGSHWALTDESGVSANVTQSGAAVSDGVIYLIDGVLVRPA